MPIKSKQIGNKFENKTAKILSNWIFDDDISIIRSTTSGALKNEKAKYNGDLIPIGDKIYKKFKKFPFLFECKIGYEKFIPTFCNYNIITKWLDKCEEEITKDQFIICLIAKFGPRKKEIVILNTKLLIEEYITFISTNKKYYVYKLSDLIEYEIQTIFPKEICDSIFINNMTLFS